jgi:3'-phosphoadenosine 5'-phosphosulfate sulfotransferase (PAPS reductase)/FAD synthetase
VLKYGFPGPGAHSLPYRWLKELQVDRLVSDYKKKWNDRIMLITGVRLAESNRRMGNVVEVKRDGCQLWVSPILDWTKDDLREYRRAHNVPESEVAALLHMSGECLCGAFAHKDEIKDLHAFYPETAHRIHKLEREVEAAGQARCVWGTGKVRKSKGGILCVGCEAAQL